MATSHQNSLQDKEALQTASLELPNIEVVDLPEQKRGTNDDVRDMYRMGKTQEMKRNFSLFTIFGFSMILMCTWEVTLGTSFFALFNGGTAGFIWMHVVAWSGFLCINTSMAEMASMAPTTGGQYHWVSEFAPYDQQKFLSFLIGWLCVLGWQTGSANTALLAGQQIQGLLILNYPTYIYERWHTTLITFAVGTFSFGVNTVLAKFLPLIEGVFLFVHVLGFFGIMATLWALGPKGDAAEVFTTFNNYGGYSSNGGSALVGLFAVILPLLGADAAVHMSEELRDASKQLPRSMIFTTIFNGLLGFIMVITFCMTLGNLDDIINTPTFQPFIAVFYQATQSLPATNAMTAIVIIMQMFCNLSIVATASRQLFAFARDKGVPGYSWFAHVRPGWDVPVNSIFVSWLVTCLLACINIGSPVAFNSISSLSISGVVASYIISIGCMARKRILNEALLPSKFSLGRWPGLALNIVSLAYLTLFFVMSFFPISVNPVPSAMNWAIVMFVGIIGLALLHYMQARHVYDGPVEYVRKNI